jgi:nitroreductase/NAD-dependent dihydropyrimidine dehydrogenase PreA subunit
MAEKILIDQSKCTGCLLCAKVCFVNYQPAGNGKANTLETPLLCAECGHCVAVCPTGAITHPGVTNSDCEPLDEANRPSYDQFMGFLKMRRSRREFRDQEIPRELIDKLLSAAVQAPNGLNRHNVCYTVITDSRVLKELSDRAIDLTAKLMELLKNPVGRFLFKLLQAKTYRELEFLFPLMEHIGSLRESGLDLVAYNAPCAILVHTAKDDLCGSEDSVYAASLIQYAAETLGLGTCCIGFITGPVNSDKALKELVGLPKDHKVHTSLVVGYPQFKYSRSTPKTKANVTYV